MNTPYSAAQKQWQFIGFCGNNLGRSTQFELNMEGSNLYLGVSSLHSTASLLRLPQRAAFNGRNHGKLVSLRALAHEEDIVCRTGPREASVGIGATTCFGMERPSLTPPGSFPLHRHVFHSKPACLNSPFDDIDSLY